jgi:pantoate--beta-alanine ligase
MQRFAEEERRRGRRLGFVPTMGALHEGHLSLVREARRRVDTVVVSIFVNPIQFNSRSDFDLYPRDDERDGRFLRDAGVDALFLPSVDEMYPHGFGTRVGVAGVSEPPCGAHRPGHFEGVATVVVKLFLAVKPHVAVFGEKDYQQLQVIRRMVADLGFDLEIVGGATMREPDGLAMSSRNRRLSPVDRERARSVPAGIAEVRRAFARGEEDPRRLEALFRATIGSAEGVRIEYAELRDAATLAPVDKIERAAVLAVAVWVGEVRLIDNTILEPAELALAAGGGVLR